MFTIDNIMAKQYIKIQVKTIKSKPISRMEKLASEWFGFQEDFYNLIQEARQQMVEKIQSTRKREPENDNLANNIKVYEIDTTAKQHLGIGNIDELNKNAPYWSVQNYGVTKNNEPFIPGNGKNVPYGAFKNTGKPVPGGSGERWEKGKENAIGKFGAYHTFSAKKPIEPKHYIEAGKRYIEQNLDKIIRKYIQEKLKNG